MTAITVKYAVRWRARTVAGAHVYIILSYYPFCPYIYTTPTPPPARHFYIRRQCDIIIDTVYYTIGGIRDIMLRVHMSTQIPLAGRPKKPPFYLSFFRSL